MTTISNAHALKEAVNGQRGALDAWLEVNDEAECREAIKMLLKLQDRDTRHACADAVAALHFEEGGCVISVTRAHQACMNAQAI